MVNLIKACSLNYDNFKKIEGSNHIATFSSQLNFAEQLVRLRPKTVLDYGTGIGTFIPIVLNNSDASIYAVEKNEWCRNKFSEIIFNDNFTSASRVILLDALPNLEFNIVIIDDEISRSEIHKILMSQKLLLIFIEGWRNRTVGQISKRLPLFGYTAEFYRGSSRLMEAGRLGKRGIEVEKSGSYFLLSPGKPLANITSWLGRVNQTKEFSEIFKEFYFWVNRLLSIRSRFRKLRNK